MNDVHGAVAKCGRPIVCSGYQTVQRTRGDPMAVEGRVIPIKEFLQTTVSGCL